MHALAHEEGASSRAAVNPWNYTLRDELGTRRAAVDARCRVDFSRHLLAITADSPGHFQPNFDEWMGAAEAVSFARRELDAILVALAPLPTSNASSARAETYAKTTIRVHLSETFDVATRAVLDGIATIADLATTADARAFLNVKLLADCESEYWNLVSVAAAIAGEAEAAVTSVDLALVDAVAAGLDRAEYAVKSMGTKAMHREVQAWRAEPATARVLRTVAAIQGRWWTYDGAAFFESAAGPGARLAALVDAEVDVLRRADHPRAALIENAALITAGVLCSAAAVALLTWQQLRTKAELEAVVDWSERTRVAVSAFVPRFFLSKMGYTSILQVKAGESTEVALAMLFADIRAFTTIAEGMTSDMLFDWVQGYFSRMTQVVEANKGNINQFIGDALFAVFSSAGDSARCGIAMQSEAQQLNVRRQCEDGGGDEQDLATLPLEIGVGLHFDVLAMGILGDERRHTCTAISASVNLASRLEGLTKQLGCRILASDAVIQQLTPSELQTIARRRIGPAIVKGAVEKVTVYDLFKTDERPLRRFKAASRGVFDEFSAALLCPLAARDATRVAALEAQLTAMAATFGEHVVDATMAEMRRHASDATGVLMFDEK